MTAWSEPAAMTEKSCAETLQWLCVNLAKEFGGGYSSVLGINLASVESDEIFKWFLASMLLGTRVREGIALKTYEEFKKAGMLSAERILATNWQRLVDILDRGGYIMYNFRIAMRLQEVAWFLNRKYECDLNRLHFFATDERDLKKRLQGLGKGIGPVTVYIFLRELRDLWEKAEPPLSGAALVALGNLGLVKVTDEAQALAELRTLWEVNGKVQGRFSDFEVALVRLGKSYCQKGRCLPCPVRPDCPKINR